jgi:hypothetical protein
MPYTDAEMQSQSQRSSYERNRDKALARAKQQKKDLRDWMNQLKTGVACLDCGLDWPPFVMEYHHRDPDTKTKKVSWLLYNASRQRILDEVAKCDLLCANCHRIREHG